MSCPKLRLRASALVALVLACAAGCAAKAKSDADAGCTADPKGPHAAVSIHVVEPTTGPGCGVSEHTANVPEVDYGQRAVGPTAHVDPLVDACSGEVACRVAASAGGFDVDATVASGPYRFHLTARFAPGATTASGTLEEDDDEVGVRLVTPDAQPCTFSVAGGAGTSYAIAAGTIWAHVTCPALVETTNVGLVCSASDADLYATGCTR